MTFNLASAVDYKVITANKQRQVDIDNVQKNARQVGVSDIVYVDKTDI